MYICTYIRNKHVYVISLCIGEAPKMLKAFSLAFKIPLPMIVGATKRIEKLFDATPIEKLVSGKGGREVRR